MAMTNPDGRTHTAQCTHIHRTESVTTMSRSPQAGSTKLFSTVIFPLPLFQEGQLSVMAQVWALSIG